MTELKNGGAFSYVPNFLSEELAKALFDELMSIEWVIDTFKMYGKEIPVPRRLSSMFDPTCPTQLLPEKGKGKPYWNSETAWVKVGRRDWTPLMKHLKEYIEKTYGVKLAYAQMNHYRTDSDHIGYHTDKEMRPNDFVFSITIGKPRQFGFRPIGMKSGPPEVEMTLEHRSLILFNAAAGKANYKHALLPGKASERFVPDPYGQGRINITFRTIN